MNEQMIFVDEFVTIKWFGKAIKHYQSLGYKFTGKNTEFQARVEHLSPGSHLRVRVQCPLCRKVRSIVFKDILASGNSVCKRCTDLEFQPGQRFDKLTIVGPTEKRVSKCMIWHCRCDCGRDVYASSLRLSRPSAHCCNQGACNSRWNGALSREERFYHRGKPHYIAWREDVFRRDKFTCQACGDNTGGNLEAHHPDSWDEHKEKRFDVDNGVTLCEPCHKAFHDSWGYGGNTRKQFDEWITSKAVQV
jgi:5-methylcytosine-specific restriction endonuclease McrA